MQVHICFSSIHSFLIAAAELLWSAKVYLCCHRGRAGWQLDMPPIGPRATQTQTIDIPAQTINFIQVLYFFTLFEMWEGDLVSVSRQNWHSKEIKLSLLHQWLFFGFSVLFFILNSNQVFIFYSFVFFLSSLHLPNVLYHFLSFSKYRKRKKMSKWTDNLWWELWIIFLFIQKKISVLDLFFEFKSKL